MHWSSVVDTQFKFASNYYLNDEDEFVSNTFWAFVLQIYEMVTTV